MQNIELVKLSGANGDKVSNFIRLNLPSGDPIFGALCDRMKPEQYEGSQLRGHNFIKFHLYVIWVQVIRNLLLYS